MPRLEIIGSKFTNSYQEKSIERRGSYLRREMSGERRREGRR